MNRLACCFLVGVLLALPALPADAQPAAPPASGSRLTYYGLSYIIASPELQNELKVSAGQLGQVKGIWRRANSAGPGGPGPEIDKALAETLQAGQIMRLKQILLQQFGKSPLAITIPEIVEELKLTENQKKALNEGSVLVSVLTDAQKRMWQTMVGEKFAGALNHEVSIFTTLPVNFQFVLSNSVQDELKLTMVQQKQIAELWQKWQEAFGFPSLRVLRIRRGSWPS